MDWADFAARLRATLPEITDRCYLVIAAPHGGGYVQFAASADMLDAEAAGPEFVTGVGAHGSDDPVLSAAGWTPPTRSRPNWSSRQELPALTAEYGALAGRCVTALRDVYRVAGPGVLSYRAWREPETQPPGVTWSPERFDELDPGENPLPLPGLGLPTRSAG